jgi:hypothetical protein
VQQRANDIEARRRDERRRADLAEPQRRAAEALDQFGVKQQRKSAHRRRSEREGERAERDQYADLADAEPLLRIGAIAHDRARKHRSADVMGERIGCERRHRDVSPT